jgi:hypothetical protein
LDIVIQDLGLPMSGFLRIQINLVNEDFSFNEKIKPFSNLSVPMVWMEIVSSSLCRKF